MCDRAKTVGRIEPLQVSYIGVAVVGANVLIVIVPAIFRAQMGIAVTAIYRAAAAGVQWGW